MPSEPQPFFQSVFDETKRVDVDCNAIDPNSTVLITVPNHGGTLFEAASTVLEQTNGVDAANVQLAIELLMQAVALLSTPVNLNAAMIAAIDARSGGGGGDGAVGIRTPSGLVWSVTLPAFTFSRASNSQYLGCLN